MKTFTRKEQAANLLKAKNEKGKPKLGSGKRFQELAKELGSKKGKSKVKDPKALAAFIGRNKFGKVAFAKLGVKGK
jgi:hypothetical protein